MRRIEVLAVAAFVVVGAFADEDKVRTWRFLPADAGQLPDGWRSAKTGRGQGSVWKVVEDKSAPSKSGAVLAQTAEGPTGLYNLCIAQDTAYKDLELTVAFKSVEGIIDQGGGLVWRYRDADNYYVARVNPLEANFRVYKVVAGKRTQLGTTKVNAPADTWHTLQVVHEGDHITCSLNGTKHLDVKDETFAGAGQVGLWTKADAQTRFDGLHVRGR